VKLKENVLVKGNFCVSFTNTTFDIAYTQGFRRGLIGVQSGGRRLIIIPSKYGFGDAADIDRVPQDSTLIIGGFK
jgi:FKBP-type peptidyl-prolyl cis-trans isomerase